MSAPVDLEELARRLEAATPGPWGRYGSSIDPLTGRDGPPRPSKGSLEAAPGLSIGSVQHTEPLARFSGYLLPVEANADLVVAAVNALPALLAEVRALRDDAEELRATREEIRAVAERWGQRAEAAEAEVARLRRLVEEYFAACHPDSDYRSPTERDLLVALTPRPEASGDA